VRHLSIIIRQMSVLSNCQSPARDGLLPSVGSNLRACALDCQVAEKSRPPRRSRRHNAGLWEVRVEILNSGFYSHLNGNEDVFSAGLFHAKLCKNTWSLQMDPAALGCGGIIDDACSCPTNHR
jgi:hypothetical protein